MIDLVVCPKCKSSDCYEEGCDTDRGFKSDGFFVCRDCGCEFDEDGVLEDE